MTKITTPNAESLIHELDYPLRQYAQWRRIKATEHPDDTRNLRAAEMAERVADTLKDIPKNLLLKLEPHVEWDKYDECQMLTEAEESIQTLGFHWSARSATDFIEAMLPEPAGEIEAA